MIGIIGATDFEMGKLLPSIKTREIKTIGGFDFYIGELFEKEVIAVKCGIGKVFMAMCCQTLLLNFKVDIIINIGAAGALKEGLHMGDVVLVDKVVQYDMDTTAFGDPLGMISGINKVMFDCKICPEFEKALVDGGVNCVIGHNATADMFCTKSETKKMLTNHFDCTSVDMEAGALAQVCYVNGADFESIKIISDGANDDSGEDYNKYTGTVGERVMEILCIRFSLM